MFGPKKALLSSGITCLPAEKETTVHGTQPVPCWLETNGYPINGSMNVDKNSEGHAPCQNWNDRQAPAPVVSSNAPGTIADFPEKFTAH